jgi:hypothetical protein
MGSTIAKWMSSLYQNGWLHCTKIVEIIAKRLSKQKMADSRGSQTRWVNRLGRAHVSSIGSVMREYHSLGRARLGSIRSTQAPHLTGARTSISRARGRSARSVDRLVGLGDGPMGPSP